MIFLIAESKVHHRPISSQVKENNKVKLYPLAELSDVYDYLQVIQPSLLIILVINDISIPFLLIHIETYCIYNYIAPQQVLVASTDIPAVIIFPKLQLNGCLLCSACYLNAEFIEQNESSVLCMLWCNMHTA